MPAAETPPAARERTDAGWSDAELASNPHADAGKAGKVRSMFASIAHAYDLNNRLHSFGRDQAWRRATVRIAGLRPGDEVLDVACGTGDLARAFASAGAGRVVGADYTPEMLDLAREKPRVGAGVEYLEADAMALPFEDASFDVVSIAFGIRNVAEPARAFAEFRRVLRPGGRLVVLEFSEPGFAPLRWASNFYTRRVMPLTATLVSRDRSGAYRYLPRSVETFLDREAMASAIERAGFAPVTQRALTFGVCVCWRGEVR